MPAARVIGKEARTLARGFQAAEKEALAEVAEQVTKGGLQVRVNPRTGKIGGVNVSGLNAAKGGETAATKAGRQAHKEFAEKVKQKPGWKSEPRLTDPQTGKTVKPDALTPSGKAVELKPNTDTGRAQGKRQLPKYERATGENGRVIYYDP